ncbi:MAG: tyrosine-type recombinase/integrase [Alphaproteobacteria bacterium]
MRSGMTEEWVSDAEYPPLKMRLRNNTRPCWYVSYKHPQNGKRIRTKLSDVDTSQNPSEARELARNVVNLATKARHSPSEAAAFDNRAITVTQVVDDYIYRSENGLSGKPKLSPKTIAGYLGDKKIIEALFSGIHAVDLTDDMVSQAFASNLERIAAEQATKIKLAEQEIDENIQKIRAPAQYGLTPRNVRRLIKTNIRLDEKIEKLTNPKKTGVVQNRNTARLLNAAFRSARLLDDYPKLPTKFEVNFGTYKPKRRSFDKDQLKAIEYECAKRLSDKETYDKTWRHACFVMCLLYSGARKTELMTADICTAHIGNNRMSIDCPNNKEGNELKRVYFMRQARPYLTALLADRDEGQLFDQTSYPETAARNIVKAAGVNAWTGFHGLRHTYASIAYAAGESIEKLAAALGQSSLSVTQTYGYLFDDELAKTNERMSDARDNF